jgi:hypothetical protein
MADTATVIGRLKPSPAMPRGIRTVKAASGPYAAELNASSPNTESPANEPTRSSLSSSEAKGRPRTKSNIGIVTEKISVTLGQEVSQKIARTHAKTTSVCLRVGLTNFTLAATAKVIEVEQLSLE